MPRQIFSPLLERLAVAGRGGVLLLMMLPLPSCVSSQVQQHVCNGQQIVIGFAPGVDAALPGTVASLSLDAGVTISYVRHLFDHYSLYCAGREGEPPVTEATLLRLRQRMDILSVETDHVRHPVEKN